MNDIKCHGTKGEDGCVTPRLQKLPEPSVSIREKSAVLNTFCERRDDKNQKGWVNTSFNREVETKGGELVIVG